MTKETLQQYVDGSALDLAMQILKLEELAMLRVRTVAHERGDLGNDLVFNALTTAITLMKRQLETTRKLGDDLDAALHAKEP